MPRRIIVLHAGDLKQTEMMRIIAKAIAGKIKSAKQVAIISSDDRGAQALVTILQHFIGDPVITTVKNLNPGDVKHTEEAAIDSVSNILKKTADVIIIITHDAWVRSITDYFVQKQNINSNLEIDIEYVDDYIITLPHGENDTTVPTVSVINYENIAA